MPCLAREPVSSNVEKYLSLWFEFLNTYSEILAPVCSYKENNKSHELANDSRNGSALNSKIKGENKKRINQYVKYTSAHDSEHGVKRASLIPELIVHNK